MSKEDKYEKQADEILESVTPEERGEIKKLLKNLANELMEKHQEIRLLKRDLKDAHRRKKAKKDPMLGKVCMTMFSLPKAEGAKPKMYVADNCPTSQAIATIKSLIRDPDHEFLGVSFLQEMKGRSDAKARLEMNSEVAWHLFQKLDEQLKSEDKKDNKKEKS